MNPHRVKRKSHRNEHSNENSGHRTTSNCPHETKIKRAEGSTTIGNAATLAVVFIAELDGRGLGRMQAGCESR